ncbi:uncharacterized protein BDV17DRAFT_294760 [Aspergillus undulatus]|uniref:uncharacterized protein n=1 Tax=Aspergillus undulatus TaxID=1810928 RepID=UPI003CCCA033
MLQVYAMCDSRCAPQLEDPSRGRTAEEKTVLAKVFGGAGWQSGNILQSLVESDGFYCERMGVVKLDSWYRGRVALVGDAAYCPSALTGMGTPCGGAASRESITSAFEAYKQKFRSFINQVQRALTDTDRFMVNFSSSSSPSPFGIACLS